MTNYEVLSFMGRYFNREYKKSDGEIKELAANKLPLKYILMEETLISPPRFQPQNSFLLLKHKL